MFFRDFLVLFGQGVAIIGVVCAEPGAWAGDTSNCSDFWEKLFLIEFLEAFSYREREVLKFGQGVINFSMICGEVPRTGLFAKLKFSVNFFGKELIFIDKRAVKKALHLDNKTEF